MAALPADVRQAVEAYQAKAAMTTIEDDQGLPAIPSMEEERAAELRRAEARKARKEKNLVKWSRLDAVSRQRASARAWMVQAWEDTRRRLDCSREAAVRVLIAEYESGALAVPPQYAGMLPHKNGARRIDRTTLYRWATALREKGMAALAPTYGNRKGKNMIRTDKKLLSVVVGSLMKYPHIKGKDVREYIVAKRAKGMDLPLPSARTIDRYITEWKSENEQLWSYLSNPDQWKNLFMAAHGSHTERIERLNQVWEMDSTPGDWMLTDGRHTVIGVIDLYSRRMRLLVSKTSRAMAVCQVYRRAVLDWGVPETVRTDNGKDYVSEQFEVLLRDMEIRHELCVPFASEQKGTIERALGTVTHGILDLLPGFIGHNVADRKVIEARKAFSQRVMDRDGVVEVALGSDQLQAVLDQWVSSVYERDGHAGLGGKSPFEVAAAWTGPVYRVADERALDALLAEVGGTRIVQKKGIRFEDHWFIHPDLPAYTGREVTLRRDEHDLGRLYVYCDGRFVCRAECPDLVGIDRQEWAAIAKKKQKAKLAEQAQEYRQYKKDLTDDIPAVVLEHRMDQAENVVPLNAAGALFTTPALESAGEAARVDERPREAAREADDAALVDAFQAEFAARQADVVQMDDDPMTRYGQWLALDARLRAGMLVTKRDREWHRIYQATPEWRSTKAIYEDFGIAGEQVPARP